MRALRQEREIPSRATVRACCLVLVVALSACSVETVGSASPDASGAELAAPERNAELGELAAREIVALHDFIRDWSLATVPDDDATYARFADALAADFVLIGPDGSRASKDDIVAGFRGAHGRWSEVDGAALEIRHLESRVVEGSLAVADYEEWHLLPEGAGSARRSTVVFRRAEAAPGGVEWVHLHETTMQEEG